MLLTAMSEANGSLLPTGPLAELANQHILGAPDPDRIERFRGGRRGLPTQLRGSYTGDEAHRAGHGTSPWQPAQVSFVQSDDMAQDLAPATSHPPFRGAILPGRLDARRFQKM